LLRHVLDADDSLLGKALDDKLRRSVDRVYRLLGLLYHIDDVAAARSPSSRANGDGAQPPSSISTTCWAASCAGV
jgi:hypothetical protein